jgi:hypothetical protein
MRLLSPTSSRKPQNNGIASAFVVGAVFSSNLHILQR